MSHSTHYRGRFAPSPTGPLHFGSLIAAMASYLEAVSQKGEWLIRIDDIDPPREISGASDNILTTLEVFGFEWDGDIYYQSTQHHHYQEVINDLIKNNHAYPCSCSRKSLLQKLDNTKSNGEVVYPGYCRNQSINISSEHSVRIKCNNTRLSFSDQLQGIQNVNLKKQVGDFILKRRDGYFSYHLATGIDDATQNITHVVRGADLLNCTPHQIYLQQTLNLSNPSYCHLPIAVDKHGQKLSKQQHAKPIDSKDAVILLYKALKFLGQMPPKELMKSNQIELWLWAKAHWKMTLVPQQKQLITGWNN